MNVYDLKPMPENVSIKPIAVHKLDPVTVRLVFPNIDGAMLYLNDMDRTKFSIKNICQDSTSKYAPEHVGCTIMDLKLRT